jgi:nucleoside-diphosphate-sugar epimerase
MRALVTGATGFVGSHLVRCLLDQGWNVHIIIRQSSKLEVISDIVKRLTIHIHTGDIETMISILSKSKPDVVFHLASLFIAEHLPNDIEPLIKSNILFGTQLVEAMVKNGIYNLINTGTSWQHYNNEDYNPTNLYAATKQAFEAILKYYLETSKLKVITLKLFDTYGPNDQRPKLINLLRKSAEEGITLKLSLGEQLIDLVYIDDVIEAYILAADRLISGKVVKYEEYAVSSEKPIRLKDLVKIFEETINKKLFVQWGARPYRTREVMIPWNKGKLLPGWRAKVELKDGIKKILS